MVAADKFHAGADEQVAIPFFQGRKIAVKLGQQIGHGRVFGELQRDLTLAGDFPQLGKELGFYFHFLSLGRFDLLFPEHADAGQVAVLLLIIEAVADDKFISDIEADVARFHRAKTRL